jgi:peptidoglycan/LPS O-acetylase OafA/YrhL
MEEYCMERNMDWKMTMLRSLGPIGALSIGFALAAGMAARFAGQRVLDWGVAAAVVLLLLGLLLTYWQLRRWERGRIGCPKWRPPRLVAAHGPQVLLASSCLTSAAAGTAARQSRPSDAVIIMLTQRGTCKRMQWCNS